MNVTLPRLAAFPAQDELFVKTPAVASASQLKEDVSAVPVAISRVNRQMIEASRARTIPDILRLVPSVIRYQKQACLQET